jgi:N-acetylneuraminic acid mutarotase
VAHAAAAVGNVLFVFGGREGVNEQRPLGDTWAFDTVARTWRQLACSGGSPPARSYHQMTALAGTNKLFVFGGCGASGRLNDLWQLDTQTESWEQLPSSDAVAPRGGACLASHGGCLYVAAGYSGAAELSDLHCYDVAARTWRQLEAPGAATLPARSVAALGVVGDRLCIFGGEAEVSAQGHAGAGRFRNDARTWPLGGEAPKVWTQVRAAGDAPAPRGWLAAAAVPGFGLCLHGGNCENNARLSDMHVLQA